MITSTQAITTSSASTGSISQNNSVMGKEDFLNLLITQLKNQDPLNPTDSTEFTAQLAQFSSLEMLENINSNIELTNDGQTLIGNSQAVSYIGKTVYAIGNSLSKTEESVDSINFELAGNATSVYVNIYDSNGNLINNMQLGAMEAGVNKIEWDGTNQDGETVEDGVYYFEAFGYDQNETYVDTVAYMESDITGISYYDDETYLNSDDITIPLSSVYKVLDSNNIAVNE